MNKVKLKIIFKNFTEHLKHFYIYLLFKIKPVVFYYRDTLRGYGKTWLAIKTASLYNVCIITSISNSKYYILETAKVMKNKGIIKNIPGVYAFNEVNFNGFGNFKAILDEIRLKDYEILKHEYPNIEIIGGFVFVLDKKRR